MHEAMAVMDKGMENAPMTDNPDRDFAAMMIPSWNCFTAGSFAAATRAGNNRDPGAGNRGHANAFKTIQD
jgi:uncharacterized protein (DUF305 family)